MKKIASVALICLTLTLTAELAHAQNDGFGVGAMINGPTGISYKAWINEDAALAGGITFNIGDFSSFYAHADFVMHSTGDNGNVDLDSGLLRMYYGGGIRLDYNDITDEVNFGLRVPIGTTYQFEDVSADVFFEIVPRLLFENTNFGFDGALGFRYYLN